MILMSSVFVSLIRDLLLLILPHNDCFLPCLDDSRSLTPVLRGLTEGIFEAKV